MGNDSRSFARETKQGWKVLDSWQNAGAYYGDCEALVERPLAAGRAEWIVALGYDARTGEWGQGHYHSDRAAALREAAERSGR